MSKAILVLDEMPSKCNECPLLNYIRFDCIDYCKCMADNEHREISLPSAMKFVSPWCPLKEMPNKMISEMVMDNSYAEGIVKGLNDCLQEIYG